MSELPRLSLYEIAAKVDQVRALVPRVSFPHPESEFRDDWKAKRTAYVVGSVQRCMHLMRVRVVLVTVKNNPDFFGVGGVAGVNPDDLKFMIRYGVDPARKINLYIKKKFLENAPFHTVVFAIAHECAHIYLAAHRSGLAFDEHAVDICAMVLGFAEYYEKGKSYVPGLHPIFSRFTALCDKIGYLHEDDVAAINALLKKLRSQAS